MTRDAEGAVIRLCFNRSSLSVATVYIVLARLLSGQLFGQRLSRSTHSLASSAVPNPATLRAQGNASHTRVLYRLRFEMAKFQQRCVYWRQILSAILIGIVAVLVAVIVAVMRSSLLLVWGAGLMGRKAEWRG